MIQRIYIDTSMVGGFFEEEFNQSITLLFKRLESKSIKFMVSDLLDLELLKAPLRVRELLLRYPKIHLHTFRDSVIKNHHNPSKTQSLN